MNNGLADLKATQGDASNTQAAWWFEVYPTITYSQRHIYLWDNGSSATPDDDTVVQPTAVTGAGRWLRINLLDVPQVNVDWNASSGVEVILNKPTIPAAQVNSDWNAVAGVAQILNKPAIPAAQIQADWAQLNAAAVDFVKNKPGARAQADAVRSLNTVFQISATRDCLASYSVQITVTASITGSQNGDVLLEIASDSGFTSNVQTLAIAGNGQSYTLAVALQGVQPITANVSGLIPAGYYARLRTVSNTGAPAFAYRAGQEILL
jgi:hypothetical protein